MKLLKRQTKKPANLGLSTLLHILVTAALPVMFYILVRLDFGWIAVALLFLSKWRMFALKVRHWPASIRGNSVDIITGLSFIIFMVVSTSQTSQLLWAAIYAAWLLVIKPQTSALWIGVQALFSQALSLAAVYYFYSDASILTLVILTWMITYSCARHFLTAFDEAMSRATAYAWAFFGACIAWLSGHWLIFYGAIAQPALLICVLAYGLASIYYLEHTDRLAKNTRRQFIFVMAAVVMFIILFSDWSDKIN